VATRKVFLTPEGMDIVFAKPLSPKRPQTRPRIDGPLTAREREIVCLLAQSHSNKETAAKLGVSLRTIEAHRANIMRKLELHALADLVRYAIRNHIIEA
jgi:DNA-binding NarL/FixJ family response regulator